MRKVEKRSQKKIKLLSVIIPAFKKEGTIHKDLAHIRSVLSQLRYKSEIICVVDGMLDKTFEKAQAYASKFKGIKILGYETNKGKGYAVRYGMAKAKGEIIAFIDAGLDINPNGLSMCLEHMEWYEADIIVGSKRHPVSKILAYPWQRRILSLGYQLLTRFLFGLKIRDTQVGLKIYRREILEKVLPRLLNKAYAFDIEILSVANSLGYDKIFEAPVEIKMEFETSTITTKGFVRTSILMLWQTLTVFYRLRILNYYSDKNHRKWRYDPELQFRVNVG